MLVTPFLIGQKDLASAQMHVVDCIASDPLYPPQYHRISAVLQVFSNTHPGLVYEQYDSFDILPRAIQILERRLLAILDRLQHTKLHARASCLASCVCVLLVLSVELTCHYSSYRTVDPLKEQ
jgi:hypothetical protein